MTFSEQLRLVNIYLLYEGALLLLCGNGDLTTLDFHAHIASGNALNLATHGRASAQDLQNSSLELTGQGLGAILASNINHLVQGEAAVMLDVLFLLAVARRLLQSLDNQACGRGHGFNGSHTVRNSNLDTHTKTLVLLGGAHNIVINLLGGL